MTQPEHVDPLLIRKYNQPLPRYTSYPTVPFWKEKLEITAWQQCFVQQFDAQNSAAGISLYIHLPFCESLCTYCGCNKKITTNHTVEDVYLQAIETEWNLYRQLMSQPPVIRELHLGGGTPTFFAPENLTWLIDTILKTAQVHPDYQFSIEQPLRPGFLSAQHLMQNFARQLAEFLPRDADRGQRRMRQGCERDIVGAHDR